MEAEDIGSLVSDSDVSDDSSSWMQKIDVSNFRQLAGGDESPPTKCEYETPHQYRLISSGGHLLQFPSSHSLKSSPSSPTMADSPMHGDVDSVFPSSGTRLLLGGVGGHILHPKPTYSYSCLIALALKNSRSGRLTVAEIYAFMCENFPYFRSAPNGWKNSVRHNLSLNKCFQKIELEAPGGHGRKSCLWMVNPSKAAKMDQEIKKWRDRDLGSIKESLSCPDDLEMIEQGHKGLPRDCDSSYSYQSLPEIVTNATANSQLILVKAPTHATTKYNIQAFDYEESAVLKWSVVPQAESPPPRTTARLPGESASAAAARNLQAALAQRSPSHYSTPLRASQPQSAGGGVALNFTPTPPYSPNLEKEWAQQGLYSPQFTATPYTYGTCPYETANSALKDNSLLQSALAQSPCRTAAGAATAALTFQSL